jgi:Protein of unknown function (DUF3626)
MLQWRETDSVPRRQWFPIIAGYSRHVPHPQDKAIAHVTTLADGGPAGPSWRVTLHFHPDRLVGGLPILPLLARDGRYRSQFETGTGNGGLTE